MKSFKDFVANDNTPVKSFKQQTIRRDVNTVEDWHDAHIKHEDGTSVRAMDAYNHYVGYTDKQGKEPVSLNQFNRDWTSHSKHRMQHIAGANRHLGVTYK